MPENQNLWKSLREIVEYRRTCKSFGSSEVSKENLGALVQLACLAPNHRLNEPWRFRLLQRSGIQNWIKSLENNISSQEILPLQKAIKVLEGAGAVIFVTHVQDKNPLVDKENYAASCAAIQNILLGAAALKLESFWSSNRVMTHPQTFKFLEIPDDEAFVGGICLGHGDRPPAKPRKAIEAIASWIS